jgi:hypothetical protein
MPNDFNLLDYNPFAYLSGKTINALGVKDYVPDRSDLVSWRKEVVTDPDGVVTKKWIYDENLSPVKSFNRSLGLGVLAANRLGVALAYLQSRRKQKDLDFLADVKPSEVLDISDLADIEQKKKKKKKKSAKAPEADRTEVYPGKGGFVELPGDVDNNNNNNNNLGESIHKGLDIVRGFAQDMAADILPGNAIPELPGVTRDSGSKWNVLMTPGGMATAVLSLGGTTLGSYYLTRLLIHRKRLANAKKQRDLVKEQLDEAIRDQVEDKQASYLFGEIDALENCVYNKILSGVTKTAGNNSYPTSNPVNILLAALAAAATGGATLGIVNSLKNKTRKQLEREALDRAFEKYREQVEDEQLAINLINKEDADEPDGETAAANSSLSDQLNSLGQVTTDGVFDKLNEKFRNKEIF